jgi:hypothetical protein
MHEAQYNPEEKGPTSNSIVCYCLVATFMYQTPITCDALVDRFRRSMAKSMVRVRDGLRS